MKTGKVFFGTMSFCWLKLALGLADVLVGALLFAVTMGIAMLLGSGEMGVVMFLIWVGAWGIAHWIIKHYVSYLLKAGHVAAVAQSFKEGAVPARAVSVGIAGVKERFATSNVYFVVDKLVAGAVKQLQKVFGKVTDKVTGLMGNMPGGTVIKTAGNMFIDISLGYVDECCLGYAFYHKEQNVYKSSADGVVVYAQNWKKLLKDGAKTTAIVFLTIFVLTLLSLAVVGALFKVLGWSMLVAVILSFFVALVVKRAFVDSWIMVKMMSTFFTAAETTEITFDLYGKLSNLSGKFKELFKKAETEQEVAPAPVETAETVFENPASSDISSGIKIRFCPQCGTRHEVVVKYCMACGIPF